MPSRISRAAFLVLGSIGGATLAACSSGATGNPFVQTATVRFINGSPDAGPVDFSVAGTSIGKSVPYPGNAPNGGSLAANQTNYVNIPVGQQAMTVYPAGSGTPLSLSPASPSTVTVPADRRITIVLAGSKNAGTLVLVPFPETTYTTQQGQAAVQFHHAAASLASVTATVGFFPTNNSSGTIPLNSTLQYQGLPYETPLQPQVASSGIGFYATLGTTTVRLLPNQVDPAVANNALPYTSGNTNDQNLSIYILDGPSGPIMVGVFDPNQ